MISDSSSGSSYEVGPDDDAHPLRDETEGSRLSLCAASVRYTGIVSQVFHVRDRDAATQIQRRSSMASVIQCQPL